MRPAGPFGCDETNVGANYTDDEVALLKAVDRYRRKMHRKQLNVTDYLEVFKSLGYRLIAPRPQRPEACD